MISIGVLGFVVWSFQCIPLLCSGDNVYMMMALILNFAELINSTICWESYRHKVTQSIVSRNTLYNTQSAGNFIDSSETICGDSYQLFRDTYKNCFNRKLEPFASFRSGTERNVANDTTFDYLG
jgi:hypothetical protein